MGVSSSRISAKEFLDVLAYAIFIGGEARELFLTNVTESLPGPRK